MATYTEKYNLSKPDTNDRLSAFRESYNANMDIIDRNLGGGGGGALIWNQITTSGTKIAEVIVNGLVNEVYAPIGGESSSLVGTYKNAAPYIGNIGIGGVATYQ